jgi:GNAT superfamily N-acetyltransferase
MIDVRQATAEDAPELMRLRKVMLAGVSGGEPPGGPWMAAGEEFLRRQLPDQTGRLAAFVVEAAGAGLASCAVGAVEERLPSPRNGLLRGYVYNVATDPAYRRRGYSRACMRALLDWYSAHGVDVVNLHASPDGEPLYASLGFVRSPDPAMRWVNRAR